MNQTLCELTEHTILFREKMISKYISFSMCPIATIVGIQRTKYSQQLGKFREDFTEKVMLARVTKGSVVRK